MRARDLTIYRGLRAGLYFPGEDLVVLELRSPQDGFPLLRLVGREGVVRLEPELTACLAFRVASYQAWNEERELLGHGLIRVRGEFPLEAEPEGWRRLDLVGRGPHPIPSPPVLVFVNGVLYLEYQVLEEGLYLPQIEADDRVTVFLEG